MLTKILTYSNHLHKAIVYHYVVLVYHQWQLLPLIFLFQLLACLLLNTDLSQPYLEGIWIGMPHIWSEEVSSATKMACANQCDDSAVCLANTARKVTYEVLHTNTTFDGFFPEGCYENYVPRSALSFVRTVWDNSNIKQQTNNPVAQSSLTID